MDNDVVAGATPPDANGYIRRPRVVGEMVYPLDKGRDHGSPESTDADLDSRRTRDRNKGKELARKWRAQGSITSTGQQSSAETMPMPSHLPCVNGTASDGTAANDTEACVDIEVGSRNAIAPDRLP